MIRLAFALTALLFVMMGTARAQAQDLTSKFEARLYISEQGDTLRYRIHIPEAMDSIDTHPVVLFLHGAGERGSDNTAQLRWGVGRFVADSVQQAHPSIVIAPQASKDTYWGRIDWREERTLTQQPSKPLGLAYELLQDIKQNYPVDSTRIYVTGLSMGGFGTWELLMRYPDTFAAGIPVCGGGDASMADRIANLPVWAFHGAMDTVVPPQLSRKLIRAMQEKGGRPGYTEYPDVGHGSWKNAYREPYLMEWLFSKRK